MKSARYEFVRELGRGGMGKVYLVRDAYLGIEVALKLILGLERDDDAVGRLKKEFALLAGLDHPGVARAHDFGYRDGRPYFTSQYVHGRPLCAIAWERRDGADLLRLAHGLVEAVTFLHRSEVLHLDIKPTNVLIGDDGSEPRPVLIDFGLVREGTTLPAPDIVRGSLPYMAPEYFRGGTLGAWTDVYAVGATLYRLVTGRSPRPMMTGTSADRLADAFWESPPSPPSRHHPDLSADLENVILKCLAVDPRLRFRSGADLLDALRSFGGQASVRDSRGRRAAPLTVGRERELGEVDGFLEDFLESRDAPRVLLVTGATGTGQSHFLREVKVRAQTRGHRFYLETGYPGQWHAPGSLLRCLGEHMGASGRKSRERWRAFLARLGRPRAGTRNHTLDDERRLRRSAEVKLAADAVREPFVLAVDGLQYWDEASVELLVHLVRDVGEARQSISLVVGYREEGPLLPYLRALTCCLLEPGRGTVITLQGLGVRETLELFRRWDGDGSGLNGSDERQGLGPLEIFQQSAATPTGIAALASGRRRDEAETSDVTRSGAGESATVAVHESALSPAGRRLLSTLVALGRPASREELTCLQGAAGDEIIALLEGFREVGLIERVEEEARQGTWLARPAAVEIERSLPGKERRRLHRRIGDYLVALADGVADPRFAEAVHHFRVAQDAMRIRRHGLPLARYLYATFQNRLALEIFRSVVDALPARSRRHRLEVALEIAELHARVGDLDEGIHFLRQLLFRYRGLERSRAVAADRTRVVLRLAMLYSRRGDFRRADSLFRQGLRTIPTTSAGARSSPRRLEHLRFLNEHAALKAFLGDHAGSLKLCENGLRLAGESTDPGVREVVLNLHATRANVALRGFDFGSAVEDFETALEIAEAIGSPVNQAVILNNLGIVHAQSDRYREGIRTFRDAERTCLQLEEGPSLASIYANLGILYAKTGDFESCEQAFVAAERLRTGAIGNREEFFLEHAYGLALLNRGRYREARKRFETAISLGESLGDRHVVLFDGIYRAEALIFEASYREAAVELEGVVGHSSPPAARKMAFARLAYLHAVTGDDVGAMDAVAKHAAVDDSRPADYVEACNGVYLGWALALCAGHDDVSMHLDPAEDFFRRRGLPVGRALVACVRAENLLLLGQEERALEMLGPEESSGNDLTVILHSLLSARLLLGLSDHGTDERVRYADLLTRAGACLVANPLPEFRLRLEFLRGLLAPAGRSGSDVDRQREEIANQFDGPLRAHYLEGRRWRAWSGDGKLAGSAGNVSSAETGKEPGTRTQVLVRDGSLERPALVARSDGMRRLVATLDRLSGTELPVLVTGETGVGKELVARILHEESPRRLADLRVVDCGAIPSQLLQVELFGARGGAFTDQRDDRPGILETARGGTVFIDEIANAALDVQGSLLRVISESSMRPVGAEDEVSVDVRFVFSTSTDLEQEVDEGRFRADLFHRIHVAVVAVPPLRERPEDLPELVGLLLAGGEDDAPALHHAAVQRLQSYCWPGNVRELRNVLERLRLGGTREITAETVDRALGERSTTVLFPRNLLATEDLPSLKRRLERDYLIYHFRRLGGDTEALCRFLGLGRRQLYNRCERLGVRLRDERQRAGEA